jgi:DNA-binding NarL/FixJ family response regulator
MPKPLSPETVDRIKELAGRGYYVSAISRELGIRGETVQKYAKLNNITIPKGPRGGPGAARVTIITERRLKVWTLLRRGWTQKYIAEHLGVSVYTIHNDAQYVRIKMKRR